MTRVLILDDDAERHTWFRSWPGQIDVAAEQHHVWTADQAVWALRDPRGWDIVSLDHDLDESHDNYDPEQHAGLRVAQAIADSVPNLPWAKDCRFIIHSWNPEGARAMYDALAGAGLRVTYAPFRWIGMLETARRMYDFAFPEADRPSPPWGGA